MYDTRRVAEEIAKRLCIEPRLTAKELAAMLGMERHTLSRAVRDRYGVPLQAVRLKYQAERVRSYLREHPEHSIKQCAHALGYSPTSLAALTRKLFGRSPSLLRARLAREGTQAWDVPPPRLVDSATTDLSGRPTICHGCSTRESVDIGVLVWLTGATRTCLVDAGSRLHERLVAAGSGAILVDGDLLKRGLYSAPSSSAPEQSESVRRAFQVPRLLVEWGVVVIAVSVLATGEDLASLRSVVPAGSLLQVYVDELTIGGKNENADGFGQAAYVVRSPQPRSSLTVRDPNKPDPVERTMATVLALLELEWRSQVLADEG